jgi:hypothetical protein
MSSSSGRDTAKKSLAKLQGFFNRKLTDDSVAFYIAEFRFVDDEIFTEAIDEVCRAEKSLPTPRVLHQYVNAARRVKQQAEQPTTLATVFAVKPNDTECARESRGVLRRMYQQNLWGDDLVAEMLLMEQTFAGRGWGRQARTLKKHLERQRERLSG